MKKNEIDATALTLDAANVRKHGPRNLKAIEDSLAQFGAGRSILLDKNGIVRAGNGTAQAWMAKGGKVQVIESDGKTLIAVKRTDLDGSAATAYAIADNRTAELAEWDIEALGQQLDALTEYDAVDLGFDADALSDLFPEAPPEIDEDEVPEPPGDPITQPGDLWLLGDHRVLCGDSTKAEDVERLMDGAKADLCFTSPPYGQQRDYTKESQSHTAKWDSLMQGVFANLPMSDAGQVLVNLGLIHREGEWMPYWEGWIEWMRSNGWRRFGWYVWDQMNGLPGDWNGRLAPSFEFVWHFNRQSVRPSKWVETREESRHSKSRTIGFRKEGGSQECYSPHLLGQATKVPDSVIRVPRNSVMGSLHPATFPVKFASYVLQSWAVGICYEPFCGSGTTLIAAEQLGRKCYGMEISPQYCDVIVKRWENLTRQTAEKA